MTLQKQLSHLSFAAIMLVFAALPALAQTGSVDNQTVVATTSNSVKSDLLFTLRKETTTAVTPVVTEKQPTLSVTQFTKSATESTVISDRKVFELSSLEKPGKAFNETPKSINFVPSRGQKMPWQ